MHRKEKGQSIVELALLLPVLLVMLLGLLDFGRVYYVMVSLNDAAQEGASYAAMRPNDFTGISQRAANASTGLVTLSQENVTISMENPNPAPGDTITVQVSYEFTFYTPVAKSFFDGDDTVTLQAQASNAIIATR